VGKLTSTSAIRLARSMPASAPWWRRRRSRSLQGLRLSEHEYNVPYGFRDSRISVAGDGLRRVKLPVTLIGLMHEGLDVPLRDL